MLSEAQVTAIRTSGYTDTHWARVLRARVQTIRQARVGITYRHIATAPDLIPRMGSGKRHPNKPDYANRRTRQCYFRD